MPKQRTGDTIRTLRTVLGGALLLGWAAIVPGCGGGGSSNGPSAVPTPRPPVRNVIAEQTFTELPPLDPSETAFYLAFVTGTVGDLDITVDWTFASNDLDFFLVRGTLEQLTSPACETDAPECPLELVSAATTLSKPEVLREANAAAGNYIVAVVNFGTTDESGVVVVGLTTAAATNSSPSVSVTGSVTASSLGGRLTGVR